MTCHQYGDSGIIRVLYVDDDEQNILVVKKFLEREPDIQVKTTTDYSSALQMIESSDIDVVVSDMVLPEIEGIDLLREIRKTGCRIPFIILSARGREDVILRAFSEDADFYVQKVGDQSSQFIELATKIRKSHLSRIQGEELCKLKAATESSIDGIAIFDANLILSYANLSFTSIMGHSSPEGFSGMPLDTFFVSDKEADTYAKLIADLETKGHHLSRNIITSNSGEMVSVDFSVTKIPDGGAILLVRDVEELINKENELKSLNERNIALLNAIPDRIFLLDVDEGLKYQLAKELLSVDKVNSEKSVFDAFEEMNGRFQESICNNIEEMRNNRSVTSIKYSRKSDGVLRHFEARMTLVDNGKLMVIERDITELHNAKSMAEDNARQNEESRHLLESVLQTQTEMICRFHVDTRLIYVNDAYCRYFQKSPKELIGKRFLDFIPELWHTSILSNLSNMTPENPSFNYAHEVVRENGDTAWQEWTDTAVFSADGERLFIQSVGRDITESVHFREEQELQLHLKEVLIEILSDFIKSRVDGYEQSVQDSLRQIGEFVGVDRAYIFDYDFRNQVCNNTYEWCDDDIDPQIGNLQRVPLSMIDDWTRKHRSGEAIHIPDVNSHGNNNVKSMLESQGVKSLLTIPLMDSNGCRGFVGFDSVRKKRDFNSTELSLLKIFADMLVVLNSRMEADRDLRNVDELNRLLIDNYPDVVYISDLAGNILHISENVREILGYSPEELKSMGLDFISGPKEGLEKLDLGNLQDMISRGDTTDVIRTPFDILTKNGDVVKAETSNRLHRGNDGKWIIIGYAKRIS